MRSLLYINFSKLENIIYTDYFRIGFTIFSFILIFLMVIAIRNRYFHLTMKGAKFGFIIGTLFVLVVETLSTFIFIYGYKELNRIRGEKGQKRINLLTRFGIQRFNNVLGAEICSSSPPSATSILEQLPQLSTKEEEKVKSILCR